MTAPLFVAFAVLLVLSAPARAQVIVADHFNGSDFASGLVDIDNVYTVSGGLAYNTSSRAYVRTVKSDFATSDFQADLVYNIGGSGGNPGVFFGIGPATKDGGFFNEPEAAFYLLDHTNGFASWPHSNIVVRLNRPGGGNIQDIHNAPFPDGRVYLRITKLGDTISFAYDHTHNNVAFIPDGTFSTSLSASAPYLSSGPSYLFFGSASTLSLFDSFVVTTVIPEPQTYGLLLAGLGLLGFAARRRQS